MALSAVLCGCDNWVDVAEWAADQEKWLRKFLVLAHGTPSHDTFGRVFSVLDGAVFERCFRNWIASIVGVVQGVVALDGKTLRGSRDGENSALHMVSAFASESGLCLCQEGTRGKGHEIAGIKAVLETLMLKGCLVTIDAIGCQKDIAAKIVSQGGDYLLAVKDNQGVLLKALQEFMAEGEKRGFGDLTLSHLQSVEKDHGRIETRRHLWVNNVDWLDRQKRPTATQSTASPSWGFSLWGKCDCPVTTMK